MGSYKAKKLKVYKSKKVLDAGDASPKSIVPEENPVIGKTKLQNQIDVLFKRKDYNIKSIFKFLLYSVGSISNVVIMAVLLCLQAALNAQKNQKLSQWSTNFKKSSKYDDFKHFMLISIVAMVV